MVFFILEAHGALHFRCGVNECTQRVARQGVIVATGIYVIEFCGFMVAALGIHPLEQKSFNFIGGIERVAMFFMQLVGIKLENDANIGGIGRAVLVNDVAKDQNLAGSEDVGRTPVK